MGVACCSGMPHTASQESEDFVSDQSVLSRVPSDHTPHPRGERRRRRRRPREQRVINATEMGSAITLLDDKPPYEVTSLSFRPVFAARQAPSTYVRASDDDDDLTSFMEQYGMDSIISSNGTSRSSQVTVRNRAEGTSRDARLPKLQTVMDGPLFSLDAFIDTMVPDKPPERPPPAKPVRPCAPAPPARGLAASYVPPPATPQLAFTGRPYEVGVPDERNAQPARPPPATKVAPPPLAPVHQPRPVPAPVQQSRPAPAPAPAPAPVHAPAPALARPAAKAQSTPRYQAQPAPVPVAHRAPDPTPRRPQAPTRYYATAEATPAPTAPPLQPRPPANPRYEALPASEPHRAPETQTPTKTSVKHTPRRERSRSLSSSSRSHTPLSWVKKKLGSSQGTPNAVDKPLTVLTSIHETVDHTARRIRERPPRDATSAEGQGVRDVVKERSRVYACAAPTMVKMPDTPAAMRGLPNVLYPFRGERPLPPDAAHLAAPRQLPNAASPQAPPALTPDMTVSAHILATQNIPADGMKGILQSSLTKRQGPESHLRGDTARPVPRNWVVRAKPRGVALGEVEVSHDFDNEDEDEDDAGTPPPPLYDRPHTPVAASATTRHWLSDPRYNRRAVPPRPLSAPFSAPVGLRTSAGMHAYGYPVPAVKSMSPLPESRPASRGPRSVSTGEASIPAVREERAVGRSRWKDQPRLVTPVPRGVAATTTTAVTASASHSLLPGQRSITDFYMPSLDNLTPTPPSQQGTPLTVDTGTQTSDQAITPPSPTQRRLSDGPPPLPAPPRFTSRLSQDKPVKPNFASIVAPRRPNPGNAALGSNGPVW